MHATVGEERRIGTLLDNPYPDTAKVIPAEHPGPEVIVNVETLTEVVKRATDVSELKLIRLRIHDNEITVHACSAKEGVEPVYVATIPILYNYVEDEIVIVSGKYLEQALKPVKAENCYLGYGGKRDPLRIDAGAYTSVIWQVVL
jgi:DNA polymerase III sliding clamp (beta) subunit (PCNA family)